MSGFSPMQQGATAPPIKFTFEDDDGNPVSLVGLLTSALSLSFYNLDNQQLQAGAGTWQITDATLGIAEYSWDSSDTASPGRFEVRVAISTSLGVYKPDPQELVIK